MSTDVPCMRWSPGRRQSWRRRRDGGFDSSVEQHPAVMTVLHLNLKIAQAAEGAGDERTLTRHGRRTFPDGDQAVHDELHRLAVQARDRRGKVEAGQYRGVNLWFEPMFILGGTPKLIVTLASYYYTRSPHVYTSRSHAWTKTGGRGLLAELDTVIDSAAGLADQHGDDKATAERRAAEIDPYLNQEWPHKDRLAGLIAERVRIERGIDAQVKPEQEAKAA